jgi:hypothetical protein
MLDLHAMAMAIRDGAAQIAILEAPVKEQDGKIDTLQCLHEGLRCQIINRHPVFPLPDLSADGTTLLLDQSVPPSMSPPESTLPDLIDLSMPDTEITSPQVENAALMEGLMFEPSQGHPEGPDDPGNLVPANLVPEYNSSTDMDVEPKVEASSEEVDMAT